VYTTEWERPKQSQDWVGLLDRLRLALEKSRLFGQPRLEAALGGTVIDILGDLMRFDDIQAVAEPILSRWPADPDVQFKIRGTWGRVLAYEKQPLQARPHLDFALTQRGGTDHERLRYLLAASMCVGREMMHYSEFARDLARTSAWLPEIEVARSLGEYALSQFDAAGGG
jgi:hypothetical protein